MMEDYCSVQVFPYNCPTPLYMHIHTRYECDIEPEWPINVDLTFYCGSYIMESFFLSISDSWLFSVIVMMLTDDH